MIRSLCSMTYTCPSQSKPRRPALPDICRNSPGFNKRRARPSNFTTSVKITDFAGMLRPIAKVSVAKITGKRPSAKSSSTISRRSGSLRIDWTLGQRYRLYSIIYIMCTKISNQQTPKLQNHMLDHAKKLDARTLW